MIDRKPIPGFEHYTVGTDGSIINEKSGRTIRALAGPTGYHRLTIQNGGKHTQKSFLLHRLVAEAFIAKPDGPEEVNHINGDKSDNRVENLEWCTRTENETHAIKTGLKSRQFTPNAIRLIRDLVEAGMTQKLVARLVGTDAGNLNRIIKGARYAWVTP